MKKKIAIALMGLMVITSLVGCSTDTKTEIMGNVNGVKITREMLGDSLKQAEKQVVEQYVNDYLIEEFYKDVEVTDLEVQAQLAVIKGQVGEAQWGSYLQYIGYADDEAFLKDLSKNMKQEKKKTQLSETLEVTDQELQEAYNLEPDKYNLIVGNMVFLDTEEELTKGNELLATGKTIQEIATEMKKEVSENEHATFQFAGFTKDMNELVVGDVVSTKVESGVFAIAEVTKVSKTFDILKEDIAVAVKDTKANEKLNEELSKYYSESKVEIMGETVDNTQATQ